MAIIKAMRALDRARSSAELTVDVRNAMVERPNKPTATTTNKIIIERVTTRANPERRKCGLRHVNFMLERFYEVKVSRIDDAMTVFTV